jgi:hypothetical protein
MIRNLISGHFLRTLTVTLQNQKKQCIKIRFQISHLSVHPFCLLHLLLGNQNKDELVSNITVKFLMGVPML